MKETVELELFRHMYAILCGGADEALTLLETGNVWEAKRVLRQALEGAEELYLAAPQSANLLDTPPES